MDCQDVEQLLDGFVDTELSPPELLDVARHAATCSACDGAIRGLTDLRGELTRLLEDEVRQLDLSRLWPAVAATIPASRPRRAGIAALPRQLPVWGAVMALAASLLLWLGTSVQPPSTPKPSPAGERVASRSRVQSPNHAEIDRLSGKDIAVRREPKSGTTVIWVNHTVEDANP